MAITTEIIGGAVQLTGIPCWVKVSGGVAPVGSSEYKYLLQVISEDDTLLTDPDPDAIAPDSNGEVWFDISGIVNQPVKAVFKYPATDAYEIYPKQAFNIQVKTGQSYVDSNGMLQEVWGATSEVFQMLKGGVSHRQIVNWNASGSSFYQTYIQGGKFLTHRPQSDIVHPAQPVKLWFIPDSNNLSTLAMTGYYNDGSSETLTRQVMLNTDYMYEVNANPVHMGFTLEPVGKRMLYFEVWFHYYGSLLSDIRRFVFDWRPIERPVFVFFANSIGGVDDVLLSGRMIEKFDVEGNAVRKQPLRDATILDPVLVVPDSLGQNRWTINTGPKSTTQMLHLRDMLVSRQKWLLYPNEAVSAYTVIAVITPGSEIQLIDRSPDQHDIYHVDIAFEEAEQSQFSFDNRLS
jgi:hypothetical protein